MLQRGTRVTAIDTSTELLHTLTAIGGGLRWTRSE